MSTSNTDEAEKAVNDQTPTQELGLEANETDKMDSKIESGKAPLEANRPQEFHTLLVSELLRHVR